MCGTEHPREHVCSLDNLGSLTLLALPVFTVLDGKRRQESLVVTYGLAEVICWRPPTLFVTLVANQERF